MSGQITHKTVFVLDHSPDFLKSSNESTEYDILGKGKTPGIIPAAPIYKSLWTCSIESMMEYIRVVYDIFPTDKLVSLCLICLYEILSNLLVTSWVHRRDMIVQMFILKQSSCYLV